MPVEGATLIPRQLYELYLQPRGFNVPCTHGGAEAVAEAVEPIQATAQPWGRGLPKLKGGARRDRQTYRDGS